MNRGILIALLILPGCVMQATPNSRSHHVNKELLRPDLVDVPGTKYMISSVPITNVQYEEFLRATHRTWPKLELPYWFEIDKDGLLAGLRWKSNKAPEGREEHPVALVTKEEANAYCHWLSDVTGVTYILPPKAVFEAAMRGADGVSPGYKELKRKNQRDGFDDHTRWFPLMPIRQYPECSSVIGCYVQGQSFFEWVSDGLARPGEWVSADGDREEKQRWLTVMHGPGRRLCAIGFRLAAERTK